MSDLYVQIALYTTPLLLFLLALLGYFYFRQLSKDREFGEYEGLMEELDRWLRFSVQAAYKQSERVMDETGERLRGPEKSLVARTTYNMLPDHIQAIWSFPEYSRLIENAVDEGLEIFERHRDAFDEMLQDWLGEEGTNE